METRWRYLIPVGVGLLGTTFLSVVYFGIVTWAESFTHALELFWEDRWWVIPILVGFGVQAALFSVLKLRLYVPVSRVGSRKADIHLGAHQVGMSAGGTTSTVAMVACCAHHVTDVLPILGLTAAATFLAEFKIAFMAIGLSTTLGGISHMLVILNRARRRVHQHSTVAMHALEEA